MARSPPSRPSQQRCTNLRLSHAARHSERVFDPASCHNLKCRDRGVFFLKKKNLHGCMCRLDIRGVNRPAVSVPTYHG